MSWKKLEYWSGKVKPSNDVETTKKECMVKKCRRNGVVISTNGKYCTGCGAKLSPVYDARLATLVEPGIDTPTQQPSTSLVTVGTPPPAQNGEEMVRRRHNTVQEKAEWVCWCGFSCPAADGRAAGDHDDLPYEIVPKSSLKTGEYFYSMDSPQNRPQPVKPAQTDNWGCNPDVKGCPMFTPDTNGSKFNMLGEPLIKPRIEIPHLMWKKWVHLAQSINTEWLAYLIGERLPITPTAPMGGWKLVDMWFPRQRVTATHVTVIGDDLRNLREGTIGDVHSHVRMGAFFSSEDEKHFNHDIHLVVNARSEVASSIRVMLECHRTSRTTGNLVITGLEDSPELSWEDELKATFQPDPPVSSPAANSAGSGSSQPSSTPSSSPTQTTLLNGHTRDFHGTGSQDTWKST